RRQQATLRAPGVPQRIAQAAKARPSLADAVNQVEQLAGRPAEPIKLGDDHNVTSAQASHELGKLRAIGPDARDLFPIDRGRSGGLEGRKLAAEILTLRRDPGIAENGHFGAPVSQIRSASP